MRFLAFLCALCAGAGLVLTNLAVTHPSVVAGWGVFPSENLQSFAVATGSTVIVVFLFLLLILSTAKMPGNDPFRALACHLDNDEREEDEAVQVSYLNGRLGEWQAACDLLGSDGIDLMGKLREAFEKPADPAAMKYRALEALFAIYENAPEGSEVTSVEEEVAGLLELRGKMEALCKLFGESDQICLEKEIADLIEWKAQQAIMRTLLKVSDEESLCDAFMKVLKNMPAPNPASAAA
jgi:hypothetical protein